MKKTFFDFVEEQNEYRNNLKVFEAFKSEKIDDIIDIVNKILSKHIKDKLIPLIGYVETIIGNKRCMSKQYLVIGKKPEDTRFFQLNWLIEKKSSEVYSIDFFKNADVYWYGKGKADLTIKTLGSSIVYLIPIIYTVINTGDYNLSNTEVKSIGNSVLGNDYLKECLLKIDDIQYSIITKIKESHAEQVFSLMEYQSPSERINTLKDNKDKLDDEYQKLMSISDNDELKDIKVAVGDKSIVSIVQTPEETTIQNEIDKKRKDPEQVFREMKHYINMVIKGMQNSLIICGAPGVGKTYNVLEQLKNAGYKQGQNLNIIKGSCTAAALYVELYNYKAKGNITLIDDADKIVRPDKANVDATNVLKAALDTTSDKEGRYITWKIKGKNPDGTPKEFHYNGGIIIITNYRAGMLDTALRNRAFIQDMNFTVEELLEIIESKMKFIDPDNLSPAAKHKAYNFLQKLADNKINMEISLRTFASCARLYQSMDDLNDGMSEEDIESMIMEQMRNLSARGGEKY